MSKKILLIDDDVDLIAVYKPFLEKQGFEVQAAYNSEEGKQLFKSFKPDVVFADLVMEHFDSGFVLCHWLDHQPERKNARVIIFTSTGHETGYRFSTQTSEEKKWINADDYLEKPISPNDLLQYIKERC
ncbi:MAG: response regulator [Candidatus Marinimicrobia bacterium]|nr:response regulator [Candidatus Neomarinimicrobiota bacterium]MDD5583210.1 response regulator [Candidatus Neomarinimicrobiota bacterium]